jgi:hypothetical protein
MRNGGADQPGNAENIDIDMAANDFVAALFERKGMKNRSIGDHDVDAAKGFDGGCNRGVDRLRRRDVAGQRQHGVAEFSGQAAEFIRWPREAGDAHTCADERRNEMAAHSL